MKYLGTGIELPDSQLVDPLFCSNDIEPAKKARQLLFDVCPKLQAVNLVRLWHSRLPNTQLGPWQYSFMAYYNGVIYAVALWNNPSTRSLPGHWLELRRLACCPEAPRYTCSRFLGWMVRYFKKMCPEREKCISYQDLDVHTGTIYKAANWEIEYTSKPRTRDRSKNRVGTTRIYRNNKNGPKPDSAGKNRWSIKL